MHLETPSNTNLLFFPAFFFGKFCRFEFSMFKITVEYLEHNTTKVKCTAGCNVFFDFLSGIRIEDLPVTNTTLKPTQKPKSKPQRKTKQLAQKIRSKPQRRRNQKKRKHSELAKKIDTKANVFTCSKQKRDSLVKEGLPAVLRYLRGRRYVTSMRAPKDKKRHKFQPTETNILQQILRERTQFVHREAVKALTCESAYSDTTIIRYAREIVRFGGGTDFKEMFKLTPLTSPTLIGCMVEMIQKGNKRELCNRDVHTFFRGSHLTSVVWREWLAPLTESSSRFPLSLSISDQVKLLPLLKKHL